MCNGETRGGRLRTPRRRQHIGREDPMTNFISPRRPVVALFLMLLALPTAAWAKGDTARLVLTCVGFARPIELRNPAALAPENGPWGGGFIDSTKGLVTAAPTRRVCQVDFYVRYSKHDERLAYVIYYYPGT